MSKKIDFNIFATIFIEHLNVKQQKHVNTKNGSESWIKKKEINARETTKKWHKETKTKKASNKLQQLETMEKELNIE